MSAHIIPSNEERLEQMLVESNLRLQAATQALQSRGNMNANGARVLIDSYVLFQRRLFWDCFPRPTQDADEMLAAEIEQANQ